ncbi:MAG: formate dehydrogenase accessory sulfurtransferase FdhD [Gammaproteobacteria bacterium]|nr:formate dehydrogenase accessory sulfurtransferase FdhD [Gammaproteobacteria bacterium]MDP0560609.1 formate dehydrogenase accessory sulfurtransferase FdhD [Candidatus Thioglobus sp.]MDP0596144.1 formate dehydrogenase accessory sulfurtransferase FdhD [SAR86 cluster bacterium]MBT5978848.1 formate dehydrogenase accessory sulfurtransferase FdhD [Gammaproteobacteria bacterium]MBT6141607.1 formate dehydrogenase accessory sulfurtransferase FdhD [Gammaproteobacteria bacterium]
MSDIVHYDIHRVENSTLEESRDCIAIEEPLEIAIRYFKNNEWIIDPLMVTMRTPGDDEALVSGLLFSEGIIQDKDAIDTIDVNGENKGKYDVDNSLIVTLSKGNQLDLKNLQRHFMVNSSCGVCGKGTLNAIEIAYEPNIDKAGPIVSIDLITELPNILRARQEQFANTGGVHASALLTEGGKVLHLAEDVGRHNALDKLIGHVRCNDILRPIEQFVMCSGRLGFDIIQKAVMSRIGMIVGIGAPTSLALDLAKKFDITLIGFIKKNKYNIYTGAWRIS